MIGTHTLLFNCAKQTSSTK